MDLTNKLKTIRELLSDPARWCQGCHAQTPSGVRVDPNDSEACQWCLDGALLKVIGRGGTTQYYQAAYTLRTCIRELFPEMRRPQATGVPLENYSFVSLNDGHWDDRHPSKGKSHDHVLRVLDCAIKKSEEAGA